MNFLISPVRITRSQTFYAPEKSSPRIPAKKTRLQSFEHLFARRGTTEVAVVLEEPLSKWIKEMTNKEKLAKIIAKEEDFYLKLYDIISTAYEELLIAGELEHSSSLKGDIECVEKLKQSINQIAAALNGLINTIPFPDNESGQEIKARISKAFQNLEQSLNDPSKKFLEYATRTTLLPIIDLIDARIETLENQRLFSNLDKKIKKSKQEYRRISNSCFWTGKTSARTFARGMRRNKSTNVLKREIVTLITDLAKLLSQTGKILESVNSELKTNPAIQKELERIYGLPNQAKEWQRIKEIWNKQKRAKLRIKKMVRKKLSTVLILLSMGTERADRLAKSRLKTSLNELSRHEANLLSMKPKLEQRLKDQRQWIKNTLKNLGWDMAYGILSIPQILENPKILNLAHERMKEICSKALPKDPKEEFIKLAKEEFLKALDLIRQANDLSTKKQSIKEPDRISQINKQITEFLVQAVDPLVLIKFRINNIDKNWSPEQRQKQTEDYLKAHQFLRNLIRAEKAT